MQGLRILRSFRGQLLRPGQHAGTLYNGQGQGRRQSSLLQGPLQSRPRDRDLLRNEGTRDCSVVWQFGDLVVRARRSEDIARKGARERRVEVCPAGAGQVGFHLPVVRHKCNQYRIIECIRNGRSCRQGAGQPSRCWEHTRNPGLGIRRGERGVTIASRNACCAQHRDQQTGLIDRLPGGTP